jgi:hypothetical protein
VAFRAYAHVDRGRRGRVSLGVREQVVDDPSDPGTVRERHEGGGGLEVDHSIRLRHASRVHRRGGDLGKVDRLAIERAPLVETGKKRQLLDEPPRSAGATASQSHGAAGE